MLDIVIPVYNHVEVVSKCLASIFKSDLKDITYRVIVVNDASTDSKIDALLSLIVKEKYPLKVIKNEENIGYILSTNIGLKDTTADYVLLLNSDIILDKDCIKILLENIKKYPDIGLLGATRYAEDWKTQYPFSTFLRGEKATIRDHIVPFTISENLNTSNVVYCDLISVACVLISREAINKVGYYDEIFKLACYDQEDYCLRVREAKMQVAFCQSAKFFHKHMASVVDKYQEYSIALDANRIKFFEKWGEKLRKNEI
jgi:GT2 family glycosyltransferase